MDRPWEDRTLLALAGLAGEPADDGEVLEEVAVRFAHRFAPEDRSYTAEGSPLWHAAVRAALVALRRERLVRGYRVTRAGRERLEEARAAVEGAVPVGDRTDGTAAEDALLVPGVIAFPLRSPAARRAIGFTDVDDEPMPVMAEVNLHHEDGVSAAFARLTGLWARVTGPEGPPPLRVSDQYLSGELSMHQIERLVAADAVPMVRTRRGMHRLWPDFPVRLHVDASCTTVKADAARRSFNAHGDGIVWAVIDSGIWGGHPHFAAHRTLHDPSVAGLHRTFPVVGPPVAEGALEDESGHGTHVAGIIAGAIAPWLAADPAHAVRATESRYNVQDPTQPIRVPREVPDPELLAGMAPRARLVSLKVLHAGGTLSDRVHRVIQALAYVREVNGGSVDGMRIHGVNLSVGYEFDPQWFACGRSPLCKEVDKLVRSGVVVVVAAGNSGFGALTVHADAPTKFGLAMTINDPGNAERAITVGSTHRDAPHTYGVSYFSSKGPTGDGRRKPDLVAPGERITSCAAGANLAAVQAGAPDANTAVYVEDSGTSMAAPHVSGAVAALLSVRREFVGRPDLVKEIVVGSATSLGRGTDFQGAGLLDLMRALQKI
ncbi:S8 family peptidase [Pseudonocardia saturnea]